MDNLLKVKLTKRKTKNCGITGSATLAGVSILETPDLLRFSHTIISQVYREGSDRRKYPASSRCVEENALLMSEFRE